MAFSNKQPHILLLTGPPGIGKTTLVCKLASRLSQYRIGGFYTEEIREGGQRKGFRLVTFQGEERVIAHVNFDHHYRVSKYGVDVEKIDHFADTTLSLADDVDLYLVDEIGKMECFSQAFVKRVESLLNSSKPVIATVAKKGSGLIEKAKHWPGSELWELTHANRDTRVTEVSKWLDMHC